MLEAIMCLTMAVYFEARGEPPLGQMAVAHVVMNRVESDSYPDSVCAVVKQGRYWKHVPLRHQCQFSFWCDGKPEVVANHEAWGNAFIYASTVYMGWLSDPTNGATHYHTTWVNPAWSLPMNITTQVNNHVFYRQ
jgi:spore germination cell wall hydrolase CwlJ-like protein